MSDLKASLDKMSSQEIFNLRKISEDEISLLAQSYQAFKIAEQKYEESKQVQKDKEVIVPLNNSLYVIGKFQTNEEGKPNLLIDIGTGYFVERTPDQAVQYCDRKLNMIKERNSKITKTLNEKRAIHQDLSNRLQTFIAKAQESKSS